MTLVMIVCRCIDGITYVNNSMGPHSIEIKTSSMEITLRHFVEVDKYYRITSHICSQYITYFCVCACVCNSVYVFVYIRDMSICIYIYSCLCAAKIIMCRLFDKFRFPLT